MVGDTGNRFVVEMEERTMKAMPKVMVVIVALCFLAGWFASGFTGTFSTPSIPHLVSIAQKPVTKFSGMNLDESYVKRLEQSGFAASKKGLESFQRSVRAEAVYPSFSQMDLDRFNAKLYKATRRETKPDDWNRTSVEWHEVIVVDLKYYSQVPPSHVLDKLEEAKSKGLFDEFKVAAVVNRERVYAPDPLLVGRINGVSAYFIIAQWDKDLKVSELVKK